MFVHSQCHVTGHKSEQRHSPLKFAGFHDQFTLLTLAEGRLRPTVPAAFLNRQEGGEADSQSVNSSL